MDPFSPHRDFGLRDSGHRRQKPSSCAGAICEGYVGWPQFQDRTLAHAFARIAPRAQTLHSCGVYRINDLAKTAEAWQQAPGASLRIRILRIVEKDAADFFLTHFCFGAYQEFVFSLLPHRCSGTERLVLYFPALKKWRVFKILGRT